MASYTISPIWGAGAQLFDNNGIPLVGGKIYTYYAGSTTPLITYTNPIGTVANTNPIIANAAGRLTNEIWFPVSGSYKFVLKDANDVLIATYDNIPTTPQPPIVNDASSVSYQQGYEVTAGNFTIGATYLITFVGTTDFVAIGAGANVTGIHFTATGVGSGTGKAEFSRTVQTKLRESVSVKDFGAIGDGVTDDTAAIQAAIDATNCLYVPTGKYKVTSLTIDKTIKIYGDSSNAYTAINDSPITLSTLPLGSIIYCTSTTLPAFNLACTEKRTGLDISGLVFYYNQSDYVTPIVYPRTISDENATINKFWNGVKIHDCCFLNSYSGINLENCSFADVYNISGTFLYRGIEFTNHTDTSRINNIHFSNFTNSADAYTFMRSSSSSNALYLTDCDEVYVSEISTFKREKGFFFNRCWISLTTATLDEVGECIAIGNQSTISANITDVKINSNSEVAPTTVIWLLGTASSGDNNISFDNITIRDSGTGTYGIKTAVRSNMANSIVEMNNVHLEFFSSEGFLFEQGAAFNLSNVKFTNFFPNQIQYGGYDLTTIGIRNNSPSTALQLHNIWASSVLSYIYDGYSDNVTFDTQESIFETKPNVTYNTMNGPITASIVNGIRQTSFTDNDPTGTFTGIRCPANFKRGAQFLKGNYYIGAWYMTTAGITTAANDTRCIGVPGPTAAYNNLIAVDTSAQSNRRVSIMQFASNDVGIYAAPYARRFNGTLIVYGCFAVKSDILRVPFEETDDLVTSAMPASTISWFAAQDRYSNSVPTVGQPKAWVCTVAGAPGTWVSEGNL